MTLATLAGQEAQGSMPRMLKLSVRHVDCGLQLGTGDGAKERATLPHWNSGEKLHHQLGFQMDDIWSGHLGFQLDDTSIQDLRSEMADTFVKGFRWMRPPFRVSDGCYLRWGFRDGWDLYLWFQVGCYLQGAFQFLNPKPYTLPVYWKFRWLRPPFQMDDALCRGSDGWDSTYGFRWTISSFRVSRGFSTSYLGFQIDDSSLKGQTIQTPNSKSKSQCTRTWMRTSEWCHDGGKP
jgi:hypothetical protein